MDHNLLSAFIERWRWETYTLHLQVGEMILILHDIVVSTQDQAIGKHLLSWVFKIRSLYMSVCLDEQPLLKYLRGTLYIWDNFMIISLNYLFILMMRFYDGILIWPNSAIYILIDLVWILSPYSITQVC